MGDWWRDFFDATYRDLWAARTTPERTALDVDGIEAVLAQHGAPNPARIIDLGCGDGRIAVALAVRGHHVTGLDYSASMLAAADMTGHNGVSVKALPHDKLVAVMKEYKRI